MQEKSEPYENGLPEGCKIAATLWWEGGYFTFIEDIIRITMIKMGIPNICTINSPPSLRLWGQTVLTGTLFPA